MSIYSEKMERLIDECNKHLQRINYSYHKVGDKFPLSAKTYTNLSDDDIAYIDQYLFRFSKLQDTIGEKIFPTLLLFLEEEIEGLPFIDILNKLEKLGIIDSVTEWKSLRIIRNSLSHNYDDDFEEMSIELNLIYNNKIIIENIYLKIIKYYKNKKDNI